MSESIVAEAYERLIRRAWAEDDFAKLLRSDPHAALKEELGVEVPKGLSIAVHEDSPSTLHIVIPSRPVEKADPQAEEIRAFVCTFSGTYCGPGVCSSA